jgi:2-polyprenyl-6-methoxyphenol hydroxylase-like FAD-dependent oxidoreductase
LTRAVTIGAGVGGLLAARVLADHFDEVVVLERDALASDGRPRKGVPQGRHIHALLAAGREVIERMFPGFARDLVARGGLVADVSRLRWFDYGGHHARCTGIEAVLASRPAIEEMLRGRLLALPNVRLRDGCDVTGLAAGDRVSGVRLGEEHLPADLVVDAGGRGSRAPAWLGELGYPPPLADVVEIGLGYATRLFRRRDELGRDAGVVVVPTPPSRRGAVLEAIEGDRFILTLFGMLGDHPPLDAEGFRQFADSLPAPDIREFLGRAEALTDAVPFRFPAGIRRRYEALPRFPEGFLVFGDAICSFNPVYGQGMSAAALQGDALGRLLAAGGERLAPRFFAEAARIVDAPWAMSVGGDLAYPEVEGRRTVQDRLIGWYLAHLRRGAQRDPALALAFQRVANLIAPPHSLLSWRVARRVWRARAR